MCPNFFVQLTSSRIINIKIRDNGRVSCIYNNWKLIVTLLNDPKKGNVAFAFKGTKNHKCCTKTLYIMVYLSFLFCT